MRFGQSGFITSVQGDDPNKAMSSTRKEQSESKPEMPSDRRTDAVLGEDKATPASEAVQMNRFACSLAFLEVKMKLVKGKEITQDITKALDDAMKIAETEYEKQPPHSRKEAKGRSISEHEAL